MFGFLDQQQFTDIVLDRLESREWYLFPDVSGISLQVMEVVERTYYSGEANADFELMMGPMAPGTMSLGLAHKRRMSHEQLMAILDPNRTSNPNPRAEQDIVCTAYPDDEWAQQNIVAFYNWLTDAEAKRKAA